MGLLLIREERCNREAEGSYDRCASDIGAIVN